MESYEQKYKEALGWMKSLYGGLHGKTKEEAEKYFPELKESEDERVKKELIELISCMHDADPRKKGWIAWLEKQGEQKPIANAEPKFKVGDFIVNGYCFGKVIEITNDAYVLDTEQRIPFSYEHNAHLWSIADAKPGDVLVNGSNIFIFSHLSDTRAMGYCHINLDDGRFYDDKGKNECFGLIDAVFSPATKEQRDLLFAKMKETGYEWDENKKELRKIEQKSKWSNEDEERLQSCIIELQGKGLMGGVDTIDTKWLKSLKQRMEE